MHLWLAHIRDLEGFVANYRSLLEAWGAGGVRGLVLGPMLWQQRQWLAHSRQTAEFAIVSDKVGDPHPSDELRRALHAVVEAGWELWLFDPLVGATVPSGIASVPARICSRESRDAMVAQLVQTSRDFPMATGFIVDGPAWGFEIAEIPLRRMARGRLIFTELPDELDGCESFGFDLTRLRQARDRLEHSLHHLTDAEISLHRNDSCEQAWVWLGGEAMLEWLRFRTTSITSLYQEFAAALDTVGMRGGAGVQAARPQLAVCPRQPAIATLAGYDYAAIAQAADVVMPKFYYWQRGYDGTLGTAHRWAETLLAWNSGLTVRGASTVARLLFGETMPVVDHLIEFDTVLGPDWLADAVTGEARIVLDAVAGQARVVPWVDTGRAPHDGDPMPAAHLDSILTATQAAGIEAFTFYSSNNLSEAEWAMLTHHCGVAWSGSTSDYLPPDLPVL